MLPDIIGLPFSSVVFTSIPILSAIFLLSPVEPAVNTTSLPTIITSGTLTAVLNDFNS